MRRTIFLALLAALLLAPSASAAGPIQIIRDCEDDGTLQGNYSPSELRNARSNLPTDIDEYSDCRDVLSRAIAEAAAASKPDDSSGGDGGGDQGVAGTGGGGGTGGGTGGGSEASARSAEKAAILSAPSSPQDAEAVAAAATNGDRTVRVDAAPKSPGASRLAADVGRNGLPGTMIGVLALLAATLVAACLPLIRRRRGVAHPAP